MSTLSNRVDSYSVIPVPVSGPDHVSFPDSREIEILGESPRIQSLRTQVRRLGPHFRTVLLRGERGTGKELVARNLHRYSSHAEGPFVVFDARQKDLRIFPQSGSGVLPETHGDIPTLIKLAHRGTLCVKHVEDLSHNQQADLLAVLKSREVRRNGRILVQGLEARIVASTTEDLRTHVASGRFLSELSNRLSIVLIETCPLRDRKEDLRVLAESILNTLAEHSRRRPLELTSETLGRMEAYGWPGNVRELQDHMRRAAELGSDDICKPVRVPVPKEGPSFIPAPPAVRADLRLQLVMEQHVLQVLKDCSGNKVRAAELLGISRSTLYRMLDSRMPTDLHL